MRYIFFILFILFQSSLVLAGMGVYPPKLDFCTVGELILINPEEKSLKLQIDYDKDLIEMTGNLEVQPLSRKKIEIHSHQKSANTLLEIYLDSGNIKSGITVPVSIGCAETELRQVVKKSRIRGIPIVIAINLVAFVIAGGLLWMKKRY